MAKTARSLESVVGPGTYGVWTDMLIKIVPEGRTHRLSVVIAGMLEYARAIAEAGHDEAETKGSAAYDLLGAVESPDDAHDLIGDLVTQMFKDAGVRPHRKSRRGEKYSIADDAISQYVDWELMPWQS